MHHHSRRLASFVALARILILAIFVAACSVINEEQCLQGDWHYIGYADGERGFYPNARLTQISEGCSAYGISPDNQVYRDGHQLGLRRYCTAANGYLLGEDGKAISDLCPSDLRPAFLQNYLAGLTLRMQNQSAKLNEYATTFTFFEAEYNRLLRSNIAEDELDEARDRVRYARWMMEYYKFVLNNTQSKIDAWSLQLN